MHNTLISFQRRIQKLRWCSSVYDPWFKHYLFARKSSLIYIPNTQYYKVNRMWTEAIGLLGSSPWSLLFSLLELKLIFITNQSKQSFYYQFYFLRSYCKTTINEFLFRGYVKKTKVEKYKNIEQYCNLVEILFRVCTCMPLKESQPTGNYFPMQNNTSFLFPRNIGISLLGTFKNIVTSYINITLSS